MSEYYIGLMSGTSMDGIDAALVDFAGKQPELIASHCQTWPEDIHFALHETRKLADDELGSLTELDVSTGQEFAKAANTLLQQSGISASQIIAIGSHGQTIRHRPHAKKPFSLQIGNAGIIASNTGIDVVSNFRSADINAGGEGAPLATAFHQAVFRHQQHNRSIVNIGGIANITLLPAAQDLPVTGFDCGPGNGLMDVWSQKINCEAYDKNGEWAAKGEILLALLEDLLSETYFQQPPPKSTGFELFNNDWLQTHLPAALRTDDVQATLCELTARSIADAINNFATSTEQVLVCGGGAHNAFLMQRLQLNLGNVLVESTENYGVHPDWVEAMAFAWMARQNINQLPANLPSVTGASAAVVLGELCKAA